ncbi:MAG: ATP-grasp domain-containing protein [Bacilli bacterium]
MRNFVLISPQFPMTYYRFAAQLKKAGFNVLGIGNAPYHELSKDLIDALTEYYYCDNMENYEDLYRAVAFFAFKYGKIEFLESNNEYWLISDAKLRTDFNIGGGFTKDEIMRYKMKSEMKKFYQSAGIPTARYQLLKDKTDAENFIKEVGYPIFVKPNVGVGSADTRRIKNAEELADFLENKNPLISYIMEEFIDGVVVSYDGISNSKAEPLLEIQSVFPCPNDTLVNELTDDYYFTLPTLDKDLVALGRKVLKTFEVKKRFFHLEFFRLNRAHPNLGKKGDLIGLEVNMRPAGGYTPDMYNFALSTDVYRIYAEMMASDQTTLKADSTKYYCVEVARRDAHAGSYVYNDEDINRQFGSAIKMSGRYPKVLAPGLGDVFYIARFKTLEEADAFRAYVLKRI